MADQSDICKAMFDRLPKAEDTIDGWRAAPIIDGWSLVLSPNEREVAVVGKVSGSLKIPDGHMIRTSALAAVGEMRFVATMNSTYRLGWPARFSLAADSDHVWPPALTVAACKSWEAAAHMALSLTGTYTLSAGAIHDLLSDIDEEEGWDDFRANAQAIATYLREAGRGAVADAWRLLAVDPTGPGRFLGAAIVVDAAAEARRAYERPMTYAEEIAASGWQQLAMMTDLQVKLMGADVWVDDPMAVTHQIALGAIKDAARPVAADLSVNVGDPEEPKEDREEGVVVLKEIGGTSLSSTGREVRVEFKNIVAKPLPLAPVGDLAAATRTLTAEFPHAAEQICVVLSDLAAAKHVRLRNTLFVGEPGGGKSRLVRRLAEVLQVGLQRYDGAGSGDNAFGGTPRRWSTGEHCVPFEAIRRYMIANPIVFIDEVEKGGRSRNNGSLVEALIPFLESETARAYPDPYLQTDLVLSHVNFLLTANRDEDLPAPLKDRLRIIRLPKPGPEHVPALALGIVADLARESGSDPRLLPPLDPDEQWMAQEIWKKGGSGSVRRLREIIVRIIAHRADRPRH